MADGVCPDCGQPNGPAARFCKECGTRLGGRPCPACGAADQDGRFCELCGAALRPPGAETPGAPPAEELLPRVLRKTTSVLFGDLVGFTPLSESRDIEDVRDLLSSYFQRCRTVLARYGGTVEKFIGDAVMAVWGVPVVHEDDAERAVRAGLELTAAVAALGEELHLPGLAMRVGVVTGEVAVTEGVLGEGMVAGDAVNTAARVQAVATPGRVWVDEATRERAASAVLFTDVGTRPLKGKEVPPALFEARAVVDAAGSARDLAGLAVPLVGRARELSVLTELFSATVESGQPRLVVVTGTAGVGKTRLGSELEVHLDGTADPVWWHRGRCPAYGDAVAFAALSEAFRARLEIPADADGATVDARLAAGLERFVAEPGQRRWLGSRLAVLLGGSAGVPDVAREELFSAWTAFLGHLAGAGRRGPLGEPAEAPVVLLVEDAQRADDALLDFLEHAVDAAEFPLFLVVLGRPELLDRRPWLATGRRRSTLHLEPLPDRQVGLLLDHLVHELPAATRDLLVRRAEGIPLFAVETVRWLLDRGAVVSRDGRHAATPAADALLTEDTAPATLEALAAARIDELGPGARRVLTDAAVLGLQFDLPALAALGDPATAAGAVPGLVRRDLLRPVSRGTPRAEATYAFTQAVTRTVAYRMLSRKDRRSRHLAAADALGARPDPARELVGPIAQHLFDAVAAAPSPDDGGLVGRAVDLLEQGARRALDLCAPAQALALAGRGLSAVDDGDERAPRLHDLAAEAEIQQGRLDAAAEHTDRAVEGHRAAGRELAAARSAAALAKACNQHGRNADALRLVAPWWRLLDRRRREEPDSDELEATYLMVLVRLAGAVVWPIPRDGYGDLPAPATAMLDAVALAERRGDPEDLAMALNILSIHFVLEGAPEMSILLLEKAAAGERDAGRPATEMFVLFNLCASLFPRDLARAREAIDRALALGEQAPVPSRLDMAAGIRAVVAWLEGNWALAAEMAARVRGAHPWPSTAAPLVAALVAQATGGPCAVATPPADGTPDPGPRAWLVAAEEVLRPRPDTGRLVAAVQDAVAAEEVNEDTAVIWPVAVDLALDAGDEAAAEQLLRTVESAPAHQFSPLIRAQLARLRGSILAATGDPAAARPRLREAVDALDALGARFYAARARLALAEAAPAADPAAGTSAPDAPAELAAAVAAFRELGAAPWLARAEQLAEGGARRPALPGGRASDPGRFRR